MQIYNIETKAIISGEEIKELHKMYTERCEQVNRLTRDCELLKNKDKCKWHV